VCLVRQICAVASIRCIAKAEDFLCRLLCAAECRASRSIACICLLRVLHQLRFAVALSPLAMITEYVAMSLHPLYFSSVQISSKAAVWVLETASRLQMMCPLLVNNLDDYSDIQR